MRSHAIFASGGALALAFFATPTMTTPTMGAPSMATPAPVNCKDASGLVIPAQTFTITAGNPAVNDHGKLEDRAAFKTPDDVPNKNFPYEKYQVVDMEGGNHVYNFGGYSVMCGYYATGKEDALRLAVEIALVGGGQLTVGPNTCTRAACIGHSAVYLCNNDVIPKTVDRWTIGWMTQHLSNLCCRSSFGGLPWDGESGQIWNMGGRYSVVIGYGQCSAGVNDGPHVYGSVAGQPGTKQCRGEVMPAVAKRQERMG